MDPLESKTVPARLAVVCALSVRGERRAMRSNRAKDRGSGYSDVFLL
jgi:hypothetical protein